MQVANMQTTPELDSVTDAYAVLSQWAGEYLSLQEPNIDTDKIVVFPNGVDLARYGKDIPEKTLGDRMHFHYSSSPDRGLVHLLNMWPRIRKEFPGSVLHVCYGIEHWIQHVRWGHNMQAEMALDIEKKLRQDGVVYHGKVGQKKLASIQKSSNALLYPCDTVQPTETGCITVVEAGAAYAPSIITNADCLGSEFGETAAVTSLPLDYDEYIESIVQVCGDQEVYEQYQHLGRQLAESRSWSKIALDWLNLFNLAVNARN
jgi:glycosyltransferase involved in cell wall biosynthesis